MPSHIASTSRRRIPRLALGAALAVAAITALVACSEPAPPTGAPTTAPATTSTSPTTTRPPTTPPAKPAFRGLTGGPVLAAKIDNTRASSPRVGLSRADVVYVEPVEGGLTRVLAVWSSSMPPQIGPVRSGRETDVAILANYGKVAFAFSGGSAATVATLERGQQVDLSNDASGVGFSRSGSRRAPYNVIGDTATLLRRAGGSVKPGDPGFRFGAAPAGGKAGTSVSTAYPASRMGFTWDPATRRYLVTTDGRADVDADGSRHGAATVVVQHVATTLSANRDVNGVRTPLATVVGSGTVEVLRDGKVWSGRWSRANDGAPTSFTSGTTTLSMATGPVWVLLVPIGQAVSIR